MSFGMSLSIFNFPIEEIVPLRSIMFDSIILFLVPLDLNLFTTINNPHIVNRVEIKVISSYQHLQLKSQLVGHWSMVVS